MTIIQLMYGERSDNPRKLKKPRVEARGVSYYPTEIILLKYLLFQRHIDRVFVYIEII